MTLGKMRELLNTTLAGELLSLNMCKPHFDYAIDAINTQMSTKFPDIDTVIENSTEENVLDTNYGAFPDKYIRTVVIPAAAHHYYMVDDEGTTSEQNFEQEFRSNLFYMLRDYSYKVPEEYQDYEAGSISGGPELYHGLQGVWL